VCAALFVGVMQLNPGKLQGFLALLPSLGLIASAVGFLLRPEIAVHIYTAYALIGISAAFVAWLVFKIIALRKDKSTAARFTRLISMAAMSSPLSLIVGIILTIAEIEDDAATLICLSTAVFGGAALLIAVNLIIVSLSVLSKTLISIAATSFFMFTNALYSMGLGVARFIALRMHTQSGDEQIKSYFRVGGVIFLASACYVIYSIRLFYKSSTLSFPEVVA